MARKKCKCTELNVFKGREAKLNRAIFQVLSAQESLATWDIFKQISRLRGMKKKRYAVVEVRVRALEAEGYLAKAGERDTKQGNRTALFRITGKAELALALSSLCIDDLLMELDEAAALAILRLISARNTMRPARKDASF